MIDYLEAELTSFRVKGAEATAECPMCGKGREHFYIHIEDDERQGRWICFSCNETGNFWNLLAFLEGLESIAKAKTWWLTQQRESVRSTSTNQIKARIERLIHRDRPKLVETGLPLEFKRIKRRYPKALRVRGVKPSTAFAYGLGYCDTGELGGRIVFPIRCPLGRSWTARATIPGQQPKYYAGEGAGSLLYGWNVAFSERAPKCLVVCEGPLDVLSLYQAGFSAVGLLGKSINETRASLLRKTGIPLLVALDAGEERQALRIAYNLDASIVLLEKGDPGDASLVELSKAVKTAVNRSALSMRISRQRIQDLRSRYS